jgi:hypothetical protein
MSEKFICGDCLSSFEVEEYIAGSGRGGAIMRLIIFLLLMVPIPRRKGGYKMKKKCDYCGSDFILPDTPQNREFLKPITKKNQS